MSEEFKTLADVEWLIIGSTDEYIEVKEWIAHICRDVTQAACIDEICINDICKGFRQMEYEVIDKADLDAIRAELESYRDDRAKVLAEECAPDEQHCTCVPALRAELGAVKNINIFLNGKLEKTEAQAAVLSAGVYLINSAHPELFCGEVEAAALSISRAFAPFKLEERPSTCPDCGAPDVWCVCEQNPPTG